MGAGGRGGGGGEGGGGGGGGGGEKERGEGASALPKWRSPCMPRNRRRLLESLQGGRGGEENNFSHLI